MNKERRFYSLLSIILFIPCALCMWEFVFELCHMIGSIASNDPYRAVVELRRMFPLILTTVIYIYMSSYTFAAYRASECVKRFRIWKINGAVTIVLGAAVVAYVAYGLITGLYARFVEGFISPLFPLDLALGGAMFILCGILSINYGEWIRSHQQVSATAEFKSYFRLFHILSYLVGCCGFAAFVYGLFTVDFTHGNIFFNIMLLLNYFTAFLMLVIYRFVYAQKKDTAREKCRTRWAVGFLIVNIVLLALYMVSVELQNEAPGQNAFAILPIEFTASFNAFLVVYGANNILAPLAALIFRKRNK